MSEKLSLRKIDLSDLLGKRDSDLERLDELQINGERLSKKLKVARSLTEESSELNTENLQDNCSSRKEVKKMTSDLTIDVIGENAIGPGKKE